MTTDDRELEAWRREWQALGARALDHDLFQRVMRDGRRLQRAAVGEVGGVLVSTAIVAWLLLRTRGMPEVVAAGGIILLFNGAWLAHYFSVHDEVLRSAGQTVEAFISMTRKRFETERKWLRFSRMWTLAIGAALLPVLVWIFVAHLPKYRAEPWRGVVGFGGAIVIWCGLLVIQTRKRKKLALEETRFEAQLKEG